MVVWIGLKFENIAFLCTGVKLGFVMGGGGSVVSGYRGVHMYMQSLQ